jgi:hypothetical protein
MTPRFAHISTRRSDGREHRIEAASLSISLHRSTEVEDIVAGVFASHEDPVDFLCGCALMSQEAL